MAYAPVNVDFSKTPPSCSPDPVTVTRTQEGVTWQSNDAGYTFTGVEIGGVAAPTGDFGTPVIGTQGGKSTMSVPDTVADLGDYSYTLLYTTPSGDTARFDPTIRNNR